VAYRWRCYRRRAGIRIERRAFALRVRVRDYGNVAATSFGGRQDFRKFAKEQRKPIIDKERQKETKPRERRRYRDRSEPVYECGPMRLLRGFAKRFSATTLNSSGEERTERERDGGGGSPPSRLASASDYRQQ